MIQVSNVKCLPHLNLPALQQIRRRFRHSSEQHQMQDRHDQAHPQHRVIAQVLPHHVREQIAQVLRQYHQASKSSPDGVFADLLDVQWCYYIGPAHAEPDYRSGSY